MMISYKGIMVAHDGFLTSYVPEVVNTWTNDCSQADNLSALSTSWYLTTVYDSRATIVLNEPDDSDPTDKWTYAQFTMDEPLDCTKGVYCKITARSPGKGEIAGVTTTSIDPILIFRFVDADGNVSEWFDVSRNGDSGSGKLEIITDTSSTGSVDNKCWYTLNSGNLISRCSDIDISKINGIQVEMANYYNNPSPEWKARQKALKFNELVVSDHSIAS